MSNTDGSPYGGDIPSRDSASESCDSVNRFLPHAGRDARKIYSAYGAYFYPYSYKMYSLPMQPVRSAPLEDTLSTTSTFICPFADCARALHRRQEVARHIFPSIYPHRSIARNQAVIGMGAVETR